MFMRSGFVVCITVALCSGGASQVAPPKHESNFAHVKHSRAENYSQRFDAIKCAIVQVFRGNPGSGTPYGTGFYISADGAIVTASHVLAERAWTGKDGNAVTVDLPAPDLLTIVNDSGAFTVPKSAIEENRESWGADIARINTGKKAACWLDIGDDTKVRTGDSVITIGFPGLAFGSLSLYSGLVSATHITNNFPIGITTLGAAVTAQNTFIRVQMPISGGLSGAPVIDDQNRAIAVVTMAGVWPQGLDELIARWDKGQLGPPVFQPPAVPLPNTLNLAWSLGAIASSFHRFASPGYGDSVPLSYLKKKATPSNPTSSQSVH